MIIRCANCNSALTYDIALRKMKCKHCDSVFEVADMEHDASEENMMQCNVFACTACGARLVINDAEAATFCAYCGQPTVIFERVSRMLRPTKILPFKVTREEAEATIRAHFKKGAFVPKAIKNFKAERICGIYVPFQVYNMECWEGLRDHSKRGKTKVRSQVIALDTSVNFCNESAQRLEPYDLKKMVDFHEAYLSEFYADRYDENEYLSKKRAVERCKQLFHKDISKTDEERAMLEYSKLKCKILSQKYVLLPVWFLTLRYKDKPYTMLVNGQTGKKIGSVPAVKLKIVAAFLALLVVFLFLFIAFYVWIFRDFLTAEFGLTGWIVWIVPTYFIYCVGGGCYDHIKKNVKLTSAKELFEYAKERQEE